MSEKRLYGYRFVSFVADHPPAHIHIFKGERFLGRFDLENQVSMDARLVITGTLRRALKELGYLK